MYVKSFISVFKFAVRKRCIFTIPMTDVKVPEVPRIIYVLTVKEQRILAQRIKSECLSFPYEALLTFLTFYPALSLRSISSILLSDMDADRSVIRIKEVPNIYLTLSAMMILKEYLNLRESFPNCIGRNY